MSRSTIVCERLYVPGRETAELVRLGDGWRISGTAVRDLMLIRAAPSL